MQLTGVLWLEVLHQATLAQATEHGEIVHFVAGHDHAGVITLVNAKRRAIDNMVGIARFIFFALQHLHTGTIIRTKAKVVDFVMASFVG